MEVLGQYRKEVLEIKNTVTKIRNVFNRLISRLDRAKERISELEDMIIETSKTEMQREKGLGKKKPKTEYPKTVGQLQKI